MGLNPGIKITTTASRKMKIISIMQDIHNSMQRFFGYCNQAVVCLAPGLAPKSLEFALIVPAGLAWLGLKLLAPYSLSVLSPT